MLPRQSFATFCVLSALAAVSGDWFDSNVSPVGVPQDTYRVSDELIKSQLDAFVSLCR